MLRCLYFACFLLLIIIIAVSTTGCSTLSLTGSKTPPTHHVPGTNSMAMLQNNESAINSLIDSVLAFIRQHNGLVVGIFAFLGMGAMAYLYYLEKTRKYLNFSLEELGLIKTIMVSASRIWENHKPGRKVIRIKDYQGVEE